MLYLPVPVIDVYLKAGVARITTHLAGTAVVTCNPGAICPGFRPTPESGAFSTTETTFAAGAGVQWKLGNWGRSAAITNALPPSGIIPA